MVNLKNGEIEYLQKRNGNVLDTDTFCYSERFFVTLNVSRQKLTPYLKWRVDKAQKLYATTNKGSNYKLVFEAVNYRAYDLIAESITLRLVNFYDSTFPVVYCADGVKTFDFFISKTDLDKYFKRYYSNYFADSLRKHEFYKDENGVLFNVIYDYQRRTTKITNVTKLMVGMSNEPSLTTTAYCHNDDDFMDSIGLETAHKKWVEKWGRWFKWLDNCHKSIKKIMDEQDEYKRMLQECQDVADALNAQADEIENQTDVEDNINMKINITNTANGVTTTQTVNYMSPNYNHKDYIEVLDQVRGRNLIGVEIGDYVIADTYADSSKHRILELKCKCCGNILRTTKNMIKRGKVNLKCPLLHFYTEDEIGTLMNDCADYKNDSDNYTKVYDNGQYTNDTAFVTGLKGDNDGDIIPAGKLETASLKGNVLIKEIHRDLFDAPVWSYIAHCIPGDLSFGGAIAKKIDELWDMQYKLQQEYDVQRPGVTLVMDNVFNLIASPKKYTKADFDDVKSAVEEMAITCWDLHVCLLSMPKIGCGANGLDWNEVKTMIEQVFVETFSDMNVEYYGEDKDNYRNIEIDVCLGD